MAQRAPGEGEDWSKLSDKERRDRIIGRDSNEDKSSSDDD